MSNYLTEETQDMEYLSLQIRRVETKSDQQSRAEWIRLLHIKQRLKDAEELKKEIKKQRRLLVAARESLSDLFNETIG